MQGPKLGSSCHLWTLCHDRYPSSTCAHRERKQDRFLSSITTSSPLCDSECVSFWPKLPFKWGSSNGSRDRLCLLGYSVNWHLLCPCITVLVHLYFKIICHAGLAKTSLSISDLAAFTAVGVSLVCQSVSILPATFTALLTLPLQGKEPERFEEESFF